MLPISTCPSAVDTEEWQSQGGTGAYVGPLSITNSFGEVHMVARNSGTLLHHRERNP